MLVANEDTFPGRVTRDAAGHITFLDLRNVNLFFRDDRGWDLSLDYTFPKSAFGIFAVHGQHSEILNHKTQYAAFTPPYDGAGYPNDTDGVIRSKSNLTLNWEKGAWSAGWAARYYPAYNQIGSPGGPQSIRNANGGVSVSGGLTAQGAFTIPSQAYCDVFVGYVFGKSTGSARLRARLLNDMTIQAGIKNVFDKWPPFDAQQSSNFYSSVNGDIRLRSYWISVKKVF